MGSPTIVIIVITCIVSFIGFNNAKVIDDLIFWPPGITNRRQYYRFITCGLIHADYIHLAFNMLTLFFFGKFMEQYYLAILGLPQYYYIALYIGALAVSNIPSYFKHKNDYNYRSLGASGAVSAVLFAFILLKPWVTIYVFFIPVPAIIYAVIFLAYSVYMSRRGGDYINHDAHFYGALFGIIFTIIARPEVVGNFLTELSHPHFNL
ncbi:MAG: rhomboid family intramembrane serine protease [Bacteroidetes bacterium]|nr:MAG: rhomboid family intramembrane serine protease [Bacteroidota bacterium]